MPFGILLVASPGPACRAIRLRVPDGWEAAILIPVILLIGWFALAMSPYLENWFFAGDMRLWITNDLGITYDQRNALVVGIAMGFAVIPNIYSIAEDAVFSVPRSLTLGSLGWAPPLADPDPCGHPHRQPGHLLGADDRHGPRSGRNHDRADGHRQYAGDGNEPVRGHAHLAANVAVEMPESEVGGSHYRVLFLAALVLLMFTFVMNTLAELIRQRLRKKYSSL